MAERQRSKVQGRIENGTLFPNISIKIRTEIEEQAEMSMKKLEEVVLEILHVIQSDLEMSLESPKLYGVGNWISQDI